MDTVHDGGGVGEGVGGVGEDKGAYAGKEPNPEADATRPTMRRRWSLPIVYGVQ